MLLRKMPTFADIEARIEEIGDTLLFPSVQNREATVLGGKRSVSPISLAHELLALGETVLEHWIIARGAAPTNETREGFRLLALHRQGAKGDPSFNACRETCRELVYHYNLVTLDPAHPDTAKRIRLAAMVAKHLALLVGGKMEVAGLGEFCCASKPVRAGEAAN